MATASIASQQYDPQTPQWWVDRLYRALMERKSDHDVYDAYYRGDFPLPWLAPQAALDFRRILKMTRSNFCGLIVDSQVERMSVEGFRVGEGAEADKDVWDIWQYNNMDSDFDQGLLEAAIGGTSYLLVEPNSTNKKRPKIHIEHPSQAIVEFEPGTNRRVTAAGLKAWQDDLTGKIYATLYLPKRIYKFQVDKPKHVGPRTKYWWEPREGVPFTGKNPLGEVPLFELPNNPRLLDGGVSELADVLDVQDRIVKTIADRLMTQDYGAFPQKWATGWPEEDESGLPTAPIEIGRNRMITTDVQETKFGQFEAAQIGGYLLAKAEDVKDMASRTRTPAQYLLGEMSNVSGETLKASESGLVAKVRQRSKAMSDPVERAMRAARRLAGLAADDEDRDTKMEVIWKNPEFRTEGELVDALFKLGSPPINMPRKVVWEKWGATPQEIERWDAMMREQRRSDDLLNMMTERMKLQIAAEAQEQAQEIAANDPLAQPAGNTSGNSGPKGARAPSASAEDRSGGGANKRKTRRRRQTRDTDGDGMVGEGRNGNEV